jgi:hypothetical protein
MTPEKPSKWHGAVAVDPDVLQALRDVVEFATERNLHHDTSCPMNFDNDRAIYCNCGHDDLAAALTAVDALTAEEQT